MKCVPNICYARMIVLILVSIWLCLQGGRIMSLAPITRVGSIYTFNQNQLSMRRVFFTLSYDLSLFAEIGGSCLSFFSLAELQLFSGLLGLTLGISIFHLSDMINIFMDSKINEYQRRIKTGEEN